jgi:hypothetical protein
MGGGRAGCLVVNRAVTHRAQQWLDVRANQQRDDGQGGLQASTGTHGGES